MAGTSVDGLISGMSTAAVIDQLMAIEARGQTALKRRVVKTEVAISALQAVNSRMAALKTAADALTLPGSWQAAKATSSSDAVTATATEGALTGSLTFDVTRLAAAEVHASTGSHLLTDVVAGPSVTITKGGVAKTVTLADGKLSTVVSAVNGADAGVRAAAVQVAPGQYRLQLTSTTTGAASDFTVTGLTVGEGEVVAGVDAALRVGGAGGYDVVSGSNTFTGLLPGVTLTAKTLATGVTVEVKPDVDAMTAKVQALVTAMNAALEEIGGHSKWDVSSRVGGPLLGNSLVRSLQSEILGSVTRPLAGGSLADVGIQLSREGTVTFDPARLKAALGQDATRVEKLFARSVTATLSGGLSGALRVTSASDRTADGTYDVVVSQAATQGRASYGVGLTVAGDVYSVTFGGKTASYTTGVGDSAAAVAAGLRARATATGLTGLTITSTGSRVDFVADAYGSAAGAVDLANVASATVDETAWIGKDVAGSIGGLTAVGAGRLLSTAGATGAATDLVIDVDPALGTGTVGTVKVDVGFAQWVEGRAARASDRLDGTLTKAIEERRTQIKGYTEQIAAWDVRLSMRRKSLQRQYGNLEVTLGRLQQQSNWLGGQLAGLAKNAP